MGFERVGTRTDFRSGQLFWKCGNKLLFQVLTHECLQQPTSYVYAHLQNLWRAISKGVTNYWWLTTDIDGSLQTAVVIWRGVTQHKARIIYITVSVAKRSALRRIYRLQITRRLCDLIPSPFTLILYIILTLHGDGYSVSLSS